MNRPTPEEHTAAKWLPLEEGFFIIRSLIRYGLKHVYVLPLPEKQRHIYKTNQ